MTQPIQAALAAIAVVVGNVSGIRQTSQPPNETQNVDPYAVVYLMNGNINMGAVGTKKGLLNIAVDVLIPKVDLARDLAALNALIDPVSLALASEVANTGQRFTNTISTFGMIQINYLPNVDYAGVPSRGYQFVMQDVKILTNL